jgi:3' exoribonuclease, RNase T-like
MDLKNVILVFIDTEFVSFEAPELLSIGAIASTGEKFYRELRDPARSHLCSQFVKDNIIPLFDLGDSMQDSSQVMIDWHEWTKMLGEKYGKEVILVSDAPSYDIQPLKSWGERHEEDPFKNTYKSLIGIKIHHNDLDEESFFLKEVGSIYRCHHALDDAIMNFLLAKNVGADLYQMS